MTGGSPLLFDGATTDQNVMPTAFVYCRRKNSGQKQVSIVRRYLS